MNDVPSKYEVSYTSFNDLVISPVPCICETWRKKAVIHRDGAPALIVRDPDEGLVYLEEWYQAGQLHRVDGPARRLINHGEREITEAWFLRGKEHRQDGPALRTVSHETGIVLREEWALDGQEGRVHGPALVCRDPISGIAVEECWIFRGNLHRIGGPAWIKRDKDTGVAYESEWHVHGYRHRTDGHAVIHRDRQTGEISLQKYFLNEVPVASLDNASSSPEPAPPR
jgi:hypothetical protein